MIDETDKGTCKYCGESIHWQTTVGRFSGETFTKWVHDKSGGQRCVARDGRSSMAVLS